MSHTTTPLHGMPVLDVPFPQRITSAPRADGAAPLVPGRAPMALPSTQKTMLGVAPTEEDLPDARPTVPEVPMSRARPGRTIVGVGPTAPDAAAATDDREVSEPEAETFQPSAYARDPGLAAAESIRLPKRRVEPSDWLLLAFIVALVVGVIVALI